MDYKSFYENVINGNQNLLRKKKSEMQIDVLTGVIEPYVRQELSRFYYSQTSDLIVLSFANICKKAVKKLASLYKKSPTRTFIGVTESQQKGLEDLYKRMKVDTVMNKLNELYKLQGQAHLKVLPTEDEYGKMTIAPSILYNHHADVIESKINPEVASAYLISSDDSRVFITDNNGDTKVYDSSTNVKMAQYISKNEIKAIDLKTGVDYTPEDMRLNPLEMMPIIEVTSPKYGQYWKTASESLAEFTIQLNASITDAAQAKRYQGLPLSWIKGNEEQLKQEFYFGPNKFMKLYADHNGDFPEIGFTSPNVNLDALVNFDQSMISLFLTCLDIDPSSVNTKSIFQKYTSGVDRFLAMIESFAPSEEDADLFIEAEQRLLKIITRYLNNYTGSLNIPNLGRFSDDISVTVEYKRPEQVMTEKEMLDIDQQKLEIGVIDDIDLLMKYKKISKEEAQKILNDRGLNDQEPQVV